MGRRKLEGSMLHHPVNYCISIEIIKLKVWTTIVWLVVHRVTCLWDERLDVVTPKDGQSPITKISIVSIIEDHLGIEGVVEINGGKMGHEFKPIIAIHIS